MRWLLFLAVLWGCNGEEEDPTGPMVGAPEMVHEPPEGDPIDGDTVSFSVKASDPDGVRDVVLFHRVQGHHAWASVELDEADDELWVGEIAVHAPAMQYYFKATDASEYRSVAYHPAEAPQSYLTLPVGVKPESLPFVEDFDETGATSIYGVGWREYSAGFTGNPWELSTAHAYTEGRAAVHRRGLPGGEPVDDWLVSPPLDLDQLDRIQVTWFAYGEQVQLADHELWIGLDGLDDPTQGGFELVTELEPPISDTWARSPVIDLTDWAGSGTAYLAWRYQGQFSDLWAIDHVVVEALAADPQLTAVSWVGEPAAPGTSGDVKVTFQNQTDEPLDGASVSWDAGDHGTFQDADASLDLEAAGTAALSAELAVDGGFPNNDLLAFTLTVEEGDRSWSWPLELLVGEPTTATIEVETHEDALLRLTLGAGDLQDPAYEQLLVAEPVIQGEHVFEVDLTGLHDLLPPAPAEQRWWVYLDGAVDGELEVFQIEHDGELYATDDLGVFEDGLPIWFHLPPPFEPEVVSSSTTPATVAPGDTVTWTVTLQNQGAATHGVTTAKLVSDDPAVEIVDGGPVDLAQDGWAAGASSDPISFELDIDEDHTSSRPVAVSVQVTDAYEAFDAPAHIDVPWPVLQVVTIEVQDDQEGDGDGLLDPGETANLAIELANTGGLSTDGQVSCELSREAGDADLQVLDALGSFGTLGVHASEVSDAFQVQVDGSAEPGQEAQMHLACADASGAYDATFDLVLGEPAWTVLSVENDAHDDALDDYSFDIVNGRYRVLDDDGTPDLLEIELWSSSAYDPSTLFLESWMTSPSSDWTFYQLAVQSGNATMRGWSSGSGFSTLASVELTEVDDYTVRMGIPLPPLGLAQDELSAGFGAGFCGGADYYCDHFPDGWGSPYQGMATFLFFPMTW